MEKVPGVSAIKGLFSPLSMVSLLGKIYKSTNNQQLVTTWGKLLRGKFRLELWSSSSECLISLDSNSELPKW
jgi:hypothetical protein